MNRQKPSAVFIILLAIFLLPALLYPTLMMASEQATGNISGFLLYGFPIYLILSAVLSWLCYRERRTMSRILLAVMAMCDIAMWLLLNPV